MEQISLDIWVVNVECYGLGKEAFNWEERGSWPEHKQARHVCHKLRDVNTLGTGHKRTRTQETVCHVITWISSCIIYKPTCSRCCLFFNTNSPSRALCMRPNCKCLYCFFPLLIYCSIDIYMGTQCGTALFSLLIIFTLWLLISEDKLFTVDLLRSGLFYNETVLGKWVPSESRRAWKPCVLFTLTQTQVSQSFPS